MIVMGSCYDVVVVGAGMIGSSVAKHVARLGGGSCRVAVIGAAEEGEGHILHTQLLSHQISCLPFLCSDLKAVYFSPFICKCRLHANFHPPE